MNQLEWEAEFEKYKKFPEYQQRKGMLGFAFTTLGVLMWTAFTLLEPSIAYVDDPRNDLAGCPQGNRSYPQEPAPCVYCLGLHDPVGCVRGRASTPVLAYNTFPKMGDQWIPDGLFDMDPWYKNFFENTPLVQLDHRILAMSTLAG
ncbi:hypothetical protein PINS_up019064 [Pythium insidiosum]|nr:hypothetical protein PINS_up019064 [Pythium insidiosum]